MGGNDICFYPYGNFLGINLTYEECCGDPLSGVDCFGALGGFFSWDFCCETPLEDPCDWDHILASVAASSDQVGTAILDALHDSPVLLREFCCVVPGDAAYACWRYFELDPSEPVHNPFVQCCQPVLRRLLAQDTEEAWMQVELDREFAPLENRRWTTKELQEFQDAQPDGLRPCLLSVRGGHEITLNDRQECCPAPIFDCSYVLALVSALSIVGRLRPLPDVDLLVSPTNTNRANASVPVFARHRPREPRSHYVLLPMEWQLSPGQARKQTIAVQRHGAERPWEERPRKLFWRGTNSNCLMGCEPSRVSDGLQAWGDCLESFDCWTPWSASNWLSMPRGRLLRLSQLFPEIINARLSGKSQLMDDELWDYCVESDLTDGFSSQLAQAEHAFAINIDGTGSGDRVYWQMLAGCVVLVQDSPWVSWLVGEVGGPAALVPTEHYIPIRYDLVDLVDKLKYLYEHEDVARMLAEASERWARKFLSYDWVLFYLDRVIRRYVGHLDTSALLDLAAS
ncbi:POGLUT2 [Symbiodinium natans]|uniref:POGLUT2 protein n=1 Tax=Symbiodinium natans TaxID=878477 RepID=A0A812QYV8_9DINO|nr:POGLUT2 [Symbiodinium natans]